MFGKVRPPVDGVGVDALLAPPQPAIAMIAPMERAPIRRGLLVIEFLLSSASAPSALNRRR